MPPDPPLVAMQLVPPLGVLLVPSCVWHRSYASQPSIEAVRSTTPPLRFSSPPTPPAAVPLFPFLEKQKKKKRGGRRQRRHRTQKGG